MIRLSVVLLALSASVAAPAQDRLPAEPLPGDEFRIIVVHTTESESDGSSSSSRGGHEYVERILAIRADGVEREFDLPYRGDDDKPLIEWHFPVRVFDANEGDMRILNREEMEARRDAWLKAAKIPHQACGSWYFTWNAFQVECDAESVLPTLDALDLQPEQLSDGASFRHPAPGEASQPSLDQCNSAGCTFSARVPVDPDLINREKAQSDVVVGEIMGEPVSFEDAYAQRAQDQVSGTIETIFEADSDGQVWRRTTLTKFERKQTDGSVEHTSASEVVERKLVARGS